MIVASPARSVKRKAPVRLAESSSAWMTSVSAAGLGFSIHKRAEERKFFALRVAGADRQPARADAVGLAARQRAEERRALEDRRVRPALAAAAA